MNNLGSGACQVPGAACPTHPYPGPKHPSTHSEPAHQIKTRLTSHLSRPPVLRDPVLSQKQGWVSEQQQKKGGRWRGRYVFPLTFLPSPAKPLASWGRVFLV